MLFDEGCSDKTDQGWLVGQSLYALRAKFYFLVKNPSNVVSFVGHHLPPAEPIPVQPGVEARLGVAALITGQGAAGGAGAAAGAGDSDRAGFAVVRREGQRGTVGLGSSHRRGDAGPALQPRRQARASHHPMAQRSGAQRPARLAGETLAKARSMEGPCGTDLTTQPIACGTVALVGSMVSAVPLVAQPCHLPR